MPDPQIENFFSLGQFMNTSTYLLKVQPEQSSPYTGFFHLSFGKPLFSRHVQMLLLLLLQVSLFKQVSQELRLFSSLRILNFVKLPSIVRGHLETLELALKKVLGFTIVTNTLKLQTYLLIN